MNNFMLIVKKQFRYSFFNLFNLVILAIVFTYSLFCFYTNCVMGHMLGTDLSASAFITQALIIIGLVIGLNLFKVESKYDMDEIVKSSPKGIFLTMSSKILSCFLLSVFIIAAETLFIEIVYAMAKAPVSYRIDAVLYILLYFGIPFFVAMVLGMLVGIINTSKASYILLLGIWLIINPLNKMIFDNLSVITHIDFMWIRDFFNIGQTDPDTAFDPYYGFFIERDRFIQKGLFISILILAFIIASTFKYRLDKKKYLLKTSVIPLIFILFFSVLTASSGMIIKTRQQNDSRLKYDSYYYKDNLNLRENPNVQIKKVKADITVKRVMSFKGTLEIKLLENTDFIKLSLYRNFKNLKIIYNKKALDYERNTDILYIHLGEKLNKGAIINLEISYEGNSSPNFYVNDRAILLPAFFPWMPTDAVNTAMYSKDGQLFINDTRPGENIDYDIKLTASGKLYSNLDIKDGAIRGVARGLSLYKGLLEEMKYNNCNVLYPDTFYNEEMEIKKFSQMLSESFKEVSDDFGFNNTEIKNIIVIPLMDEDYINYVCNMFLMDNNVIFDLSPYTDFTMLNLNTELYYPFVLKAYLSETYLSQSDNISKGLMLLSYYEYKINSQNIRTEPELFDDYTNSHAEDFKKIKFKDETNLLDLCNSMKGFFNNKEISNDRKLSFLRDCIGLLKQKPVSPEDIKTIYENYK